MESHTINLYKKIINVVYVLKNKFQIKSLLSTLIELCEILNDIKNDNYDYLDEVDNLEIKKLCISINIKEYNSMEIHNALQLLIIKIMNEESVEYNKQITPDSIGIIISILIKSFIKLKNNDQIFDISVGTGNLLSTILINLQKSMDIKLKGLGIDNDSQLLRLANICFELEQLHVDLYYQDSIEELFINKSAIAVSDLPIGYYPIDNNIKNFLTHSSDDKTYVFHLLIEQSMNYVMDNGLGFFLVPDNLFTTSQTSLLLKWIRNRVYLQGMFKLPDSFFNKNSNFKKMILFLQNPGNHARQASKILVSELPNLNDKTKINQFIYNINNWAVSNIFI